MEGVKFVQSRNSLQTGGFSVWNFQSIFRYYVSVYVWSSGCFCATRQLWHAVEDSRTL